MGRSFARNVGGGGSQEWEGVSFCNGDLFCILVCDIPFSDHWGHSKLTTSEW